MQTLTKSVDLRCLKVVHSFFLLFVPLGIVVCSEEWTDANRCMTPSMKVKRDFIRNLYQQDIDGELKIIEKTTSESSKK
jgi:long-subunit acyl-CoA synthetase (AMP-forming)